MTTVRVATVAAVVTAGLHVVFWLIVVTVLSPVAFECGEISCWMLLIADFPLSLLFTGPDASGMTLGSLFAGTTWWGLVGADGAGAAHRWVLAVRARSAGA